MPAIPVPERSAIETWSLSKPAVSGSRGVVAAQNVQAAEIGAGVLRAGGNAVDAAVATALALAVAEPWMSGLGGGGHALVHDAASGRVRSVDFGMVAAQGLDPAAYPLDPGRVGPPDLFGWPAVLEDRNLQGYHAIAVPGACAGYARLLEEFGTWPWADIVAPALEMAERGHRVTWWTTLNVASEIAWLRRYQSSAAIWLPQGEVPAIADHNPSPLALGGLAATLRRLRDAGPGDFYTGEVAQDLVADLQSGGSAITRDDLAAYRVAVGEPIERERGAHRLHLAPGYTAGPTFAGALSRLPTFSGPIGAETYAAYAGAMIEAHKHRLATMGHAGDVGERSCTTHLSALDGDGVMIAMTTTLLSRFGSRVVLPRTGILMNNGINWFDPRPGRPNSIAAGRKPLSNMSPVIATREGRAWFGLGASGGRKIMPAVFQLASFIGDFGLDLDAAFQQPRIETSLVERILADDRLEGAVIEALEGVAPVELVPQAVHPGTWAIPCGVMATPAGPSGAAHIAGPLTAAIAV